MEEKKLIKIRITTILLIIAIIVIVILGYLIYIVYNDNEIVYDKTQYVEFDMLNSNDESNTENVNNIDENSYNRHYYSQLDEYGKILYDGVYANIDNLKSGNYDVEFGTKFDKLLHEEEGSVILENAFQASLNALLYDNPEIFYIDITKMYLYTEKTDYENYEEYNVSIGPYSYTSRYYVDGIYSKDMINFSINKLEKKVEEIKLKLGEDKIENIKIIHDYLIDNVEYEQTASEDNIYDIYGTLLNNSAVSEGYVKAFKYLMDRIDIPCLFVYGNSENNGEVLQHAWNYVLIDDEWYAVDVAWDDPIFVGEISTKEFEEKYKYKYYLKGKETMSERHTVDGDLFEIITFEFPDLSEKDYDKK